MLCCAAAAAASWIWQRQRRWQRQWQWQRQRLAVIISLSRESPIVSTFMIPLQYLHSMYLSHVLYILAIPEAHQPEIFIDLLFLTTHWRHTSCLFPFQHLALLICSSVKCTCRHVLQTISQFCHYFITVDHGQYVERFWCCSAP